MRNKFTTIKFRFDVSTIISENPEQTTKKIVRPAETFSFAQLSNYQFPTVEFFLTKGNLNCPQSVRKKNEIQEAVQEATVPSNEFLPPSETPFEIKMIATAPFFHVCKQKRVKLFLVSLKNIKKAFQFKRRTDPATKLFHEFHEFFDLFFEKEANKLPPHRLYDHKINFIEGK